MGPVRLSKARRFIRLTLIDIELFSNAERIKALNAAAAQRQARRTSLKVAQMREQVMAESIHESFLGM
jgi:hypothetical protein